MKGQLLKSVVILVIIVIIVKIQIFRTSNYTTRTKSENKNNRQHTLPAAMGPLVT